jgi:hypothetical protein
MIKIPSTWCLDNMGDAKRFAYWFVKHFGGDVSRVFDRVYGLPYCTDNARDVKRLLRVARGR